MRSRWIGLLGALAVCLGTGCSGDAEAEVESEPEVPAAEPEPPTPAPPPWTTETVRVKSGQVITSILTDQGLEYGEALQVVQAGAAIHDLAKIRAGEELTIRRDTQDGSFVGLVYPLDRFGERKLVVSRELLGFVAEEEARAVRLVRTPLAAEVRGSLWGTGETLGLSAENLVELASIFEWEIDFNTQIRAGDSFRMILESVRDGETDEHIRYGRILAAEFTSSGTAFQGIRYEDADGKVGFFNAEGMASRKMFLKSPLKFSRISSGFSKARKHPVLKKWRAHKGIDYAAGTGTPVRAIGRGTVTFSGTKGGYGKHVRVRHNDTYASSYSHLSRRAVSDGAVVEQGQVIGYVGSTGMVTGPHLHFEFYVRGTQVDFRTQRFPRSEPISDAERPAFLAVRDELLPLLQAIPDPGTPAGADQARIASAEGEGGAL